MIRASRRWSMLLVLIIVTIAVPSQSRISTAEQPDSSVQVYLPLIEQPPEVVVVGAQLHAELYLLTPEWNKLYIVGEIKNTLPATIYNPVIRAEVYEVATGALLGSYTTTTALPATFSQTSNQFEVPTTIPTPMWGNPDQLPAYYARFRFKVWVENWSDVVFDWQDRDFQRYVELPDVEVFVEHIYSFYWRFVVYVRNPHPYPVKHVRALVMLSPTHYRVIDVPTIPANGSGAYYFPDTYDSYLWATAQGVATR